MLQKKKKNTNTHNYLYMFFTGFDFDLNAIGPLLKLLALDYDPSLVRPCFTCLNGNFSGVSLHYHCTICKFVVSVCQLKQIIKWFQVQFFDEFK